MLPVVHETVGGAPSSRRRRRSATLSSAPGTAFKRFSAVSTASEVTSTSTSLARETRLTASVPATRIGRPISLVTLMTVAIALLLALLPAASPDKIPIGAIFEQGTDEVQSAFKFAMLNHNQNTTTRKFELQAFVDVINTADAYKLSRLICSQFSRGVFSMLGAVSPDSFDTLHSYSNTFQMPFVTPWFPEKVLTPSSGLLDFAISMRPDYHRAIIDTVRYYGWKKIIYLYDSHDGNLLVIDSGFHEGWSTPMIPKFNNEDPMRISSDDVAWVVNLMYVGVGFGSVAPLLLMDRIGRKGTLMAAAIPKIASWLLLGLATNIPTMFAGRILAGVGCGITYSVLPMYLGEVTSKQTRGLLGTMIAVILNIGMLLAFAIGLSVNRLTMSLIVVWIPVLFALAICWLPESSIFLTRKNRLTQAEKTLQWSLGKENVHAELEEVKRIVATDDKDFTFIDSLMEMYKRRENRRAFFIASILLSMLTLSGAAPMLVYQSYIFDEAGFELSTKLSIVISGCVIVLAGCLCVFVVKFTGKRLLLLIAAPICILSLSAVATFFTLASHQFDTSGYKWVPTVFVALYVAGFGLGLNPIPIAYIGEIFPVEVKVPAAIFGALFYAVGTTSTVKYYQVAQELYGTQTPLWTFAGIIFFVWILAYFFVPETEGKTLEEIQMELRNKN